MSKKIDTLVISVIEDEARKILKNKQELYEFFMAMGSCFFTNRDGSINYTTKKDVKVNIFFEMVHDLDNQFNIMGYPMKFTAEGPVVYDF